MTIIDIKDKCIEIKGHSGYASAGSDIVCSAISTLAIATYNYLEATNNNVSYEELDGELIIILHEINDSGKQIIKTFSDMVDDLISQYPKYIGRIK